MKTKTILVVIAAVIVVGVGGFFYATRPVGAPASANVASPLAAVSGTAKTLTIDGTNSTASFALNEVLRGVPTHVIGTTNSISGTIAIDTNTTPATLTIGTIKVDASTLKTPDPQRNGALARYILKTTTPANEFITFAPTSVTGVPDTIIPGQQFAYTITGDLTIDGVTKSETFSATSTLNSDGSLTGAASMVVTFGDFGVSVPNFPFLANVDKTATLSVSIVAK